MELHDECCQECWLAGCRLHSHLENHDFPPGDVMFVSDDTLVIHVTEDRNMLMDVYMKTHQ